jgi:hypothetical protein
LCEETRLKSHSNLLYLKKNCQANEINLESPQASSLLVIDHVNPIINCLNPNSKIIELKKIMNLGKLV